MTWVRFTAIENEFDRRPLFTHRPLSGVFAMPDPAGYAEAIRLFENNLQLVGKDNDQVLRNLSAGLYHLTVRLQADMITLKENVGAGFHLGNTPEIADDPATA